MSLNQFIGYDLGVTYDIKRIEITEVIYSAISDINIYSHKVNMSDTLE